MILITLDGKRWNIKYRQNLESVENELGSQDFNYPNFVGSKMHQNSTSSDIYSFNFAIPGKQYESFKESAAKILINEDDAISDDEYGKLTKIVVVHDLWGEIRGLFKGSIKYDLSGGGEGDVPVSSVFQIHTDESETQQKDLDQENSDATDEVETETQEGEFEEEDRPALLKFLDWLNALYGKIKNSAVLAAFNDLKAAINSALLNFQKIMNAVKKILALPLSILGAVGDLRRRLDFFKAQANIIKNMPKSSINFARFNVHCLAYNLSITSRTPFISEAARQAASGIRTVPLS